MPHDSVLIVFMANPLLLGTATDICQHNLEYQGNEVGSVGRKEKLIEHVDTSCFDVSVLAQTVLVQLIDAVA